MAQVRKATDTDIEEIGDLLAVIVENIVKDADLVEVVVDRGVSTLDLTPKVASDDVAAVIGQQRMTLNAIERILLVASKTRGLNVRLSFPQADSKRSSR